MGSNVSYIRNADGSQGESWPATIGCGNKTRNNGGPGSEGCRTCWAEPTVINRLAATMHLDPADFSPRTLPGHLRDPLRWRKPRTIFASHMGDWLDPAIPFEWATAMLGVACACPQHTVLTLTKQAERLEGLLTWLASKASPFYFCLDEAGEGHHKLPVYGKGHIKPGLAFWKSEINSFEQAPSPWPPPNVWMGVTVCDASELPKLEVLRRLAAAGWNTWASFEPLLSDLPGLDLTGIRWCAVGCDNAPPSKRRRMDLAWVRRIRDEARRAGCGFYFKQEYQGSLLIREPGLDGEPCNFLPWCGVSR